MKKIAVIGATGTIGKAVADAFEARGDEVVRISRKTDLAIDIEDNASLRAGLEKLGEEYRYLIAQVENPTEELERARIDA